MVGKQNFLFIVSLVGVESVFVALWLSFYLCRSFLFVCVRISDFGFLFFLDFYSSPFFAFASGFGFVMVGLIKSNTKNKKQTTWNSIADSKLNQSLYISVQILRNDDVVRMLDDEIPTDKTEDSLCRRETRERLGLKKEFHQYGSIHFGCHFGIAFCRYCFSGSRCVCSI